MSRKNKGAALFELLHRDKGKIKLPSWFGEGQPQPAPDEQPVAAEAETTELPDVPPGQAETPASPEPVPAGPPPIRPAGEVGRSVPAHKLVPPWGSGPWLQVANGRVRLNVTTFAVYVSLGAAACVLLVAFVLGRVTARPAVIVQRPDNVAAAEVDDALGRPADPQITSIGRAVAGGSGNVVPDGASSSAEGGATGSAVTPADPPRALPPGSRVTYVLSGPNTASLEQINQYLRQKGFDTVVTGVQGRNMQLRTRVGTDLQSSQQLEEQILAAMIQLKREQPQLLRGYNPDDPNHRPYSVPH